MLNPGPASPPKSPFRSPRRRPFQFSLRALLILVTGVVVTLVLIESGAIAFALGMLGGLLLLGAPVCFVTAAVYSRGPAQAGFIGAATMSCILAVRSPLHPRSVFDLGLQVVAQLIFAAIAAALALGTRALVFRLSRPGNASRGKPPVDH